MDAINQKEVMVGNLIDVMGTVQIIQGVVFREEFGNWFIQHTGNANDSIPIPEGIEFSGCGIFATKEWRKWLGVDKRRFPKHIKYVHQIQNYCLLRYEINLLEGISNYSNIPKI